MAIAPAAPAAPAVPIQAREGSVGEENAYDVLQARGFIHQCSDELGLRRALATGPMTLYAGFDPTASSLHVGHMVPVMAMAHLQRAGHRPIAVVGGGTAVIGDPTDKTESRPMMTRDVIDANAQAVKGQLTRYFDLSDGRGLMVDNAGWLLPLNYLEFLRDYGRYFSVNEMLRAETYRTRLETGLTFFEFNYMLLQAYDFLEVHRRYGCTLQLGGSDQWANILAGAELIRKVTTKQAYALTCPLLMNAAGSKMGKTAGGQKVWLDAALTLPYEFYQYWINTPDADVARDLALFTFLPMDEIQALTAVEGAALRVAKERLAFEVTTLAHGREASQQAQTASRRLFGSASPEELRGESARGESAMAAGSVAVTEVDSARLETGIPAVDLLVEAGLAASKGAARRLIDQGGAYLHDERLTPRSITTADLRGGSLLLRHGKKRYQRVAPR